MTEPTLRMVPDEEAGAQLIAEVQVYLQPDGRLMGGYSWRPDRLPQVTGVGGQVPALTDLYVLPDVLWRVTGQLVLALGEAIQEARARGATVIALPPPAPGPGKNGR